VLRGHGGGITISVATVNYEHRNGSNGQQSSEITNTDLVAAKFEIEEAKTRIVGT
jgi:hypothetical protein